MNQGTNANERSTGSSIVVLAKLLPTSYSSLLSSWNASLWPLMAINLAQMEEEEAVFMRHNHKKHGNYVSKQRKTQKGNFVADLALFWKKYQTKANNKADSDRSHVVV